MQRDMHLIKQILKYVERYGPGAKGWLEDPEIPGYTDDQIEYHIGLCKQAGYLAMHKVGRLKGLTWEGHNALDRLRAEHAQGSVEA